MKEGIFIKLI